ncbi:MULTISPECIES: ABC transporter ATP-binding protein [unclassified Streptomyces]|uniref:ABC transporter ATP-binding protein n=1 Tax=unclassified Streptomyces TaxID=2593676 RepID=UPI0013699E36|nr:MULTISPECIES: ABC transporter ATP-binding protein [unclassified Streptomyces]NEA06267.1 ABC transporter ATP-binding protein [Streptomyces sp. SID10116]MYY87574.1 dipeptide ABC transporter ATP-binding protein [Streptomyces sp. SID335]MYZ15247.1 dipeptide ABC transporter ATP-binding protein [Streptomyces sp. SID337]NDZ88595.1 ABC transporter ATP-binding protein [Streptomyces sp. SID10115]NEB45598.1 ABC transporter ATP-binding protein [Streptomyces sp. SID339]
MTDPQRTTATDPLLSIEELRVDIASRDRTVHALDGVSLSLAPGEALGIVGESGCGKTMTALSVLGLLPPGGEITGGRVLFDGRDLAAAPAPVLQDVRGNTIGMVFQDPLTSLNPTMTIGAQVAEPLLLHRPGIGRKEAWARAREMLRLVGMPQPAERMKAYPHQLSGGMRQRVAIAMALVCEPKLLIADEPTTALDVTTQHQILELVDDLRARLGMAMILVTHDLGVIANRVDRVAVMYAGKVAEQADVRSLFARPRHRYTEALFAALPERAAGSGTALHTIPGLPPNLATRPTGCRFAPRCTFATDECRSTEPPLADDEPLGARHRFACFHPVPTEAATEDETVAPATVPATGAPGGVLLELEALVKEFPLKGGAFARSRGTVSAVGGVSLTIRKGETFGMVGESGCGKTTLGRIVAGLEEPTSGAVRFEGSDPARMSRAERRAHRRRVQLMFQDSTAAMDPRMRVGDILREPLVIQGVGSRAEQESLVAELLDAVGLPRGAVRRYPHEFSGGQRQRLGLARALTLSPDLVVADEPVSALDVSVQAQILNLMRELQRERGLTYLFISHDLAVVRHLADTVGVMYLGKLVESGPAEQVYAHPLHPYTRGLLDTVNLPDPAAAGSGPERIPLEGETPSAAKPPSGCRFRTRCPLAQDVCATTEPPVSTPNGTGHRVACHFPLASPRLASTV